MKKSILISIVLLIVLGITTSVFAYETSDFSIDVPSEFTEAGTNIFGAADGSSFNIQITDYDQKKNGYPYTEANLNDYADTLEKSGAKVSKKEISTFTKNNYKCMKIEATVYGVPCRQFLVVSGDKAYALTLGATDASKLDNGSLKNVENSFTFKNYKEPSEPANIMIWVIGGAAIGAVIGVVVFFGMKKNKNTNNTAA